MIDFNNIIQNLSQDDIIIMETLRNEGSIIQAVGLTKEKLSRLTNLSLYQIKVSIARLSLVDFIINGGSIGRSRSHRYYLSEFGINALELVDKKL